MTANGAILLVKLVLLIVLLNLLYIKGQLHQCHLTLSSD